MFSLGAVALRQSFKLNLSLGAVALRPCQVHKVDVQLLRNFTLKISVK
jgi:hypothetical protein